MYISEAEIKSITWIKSNSEILSLWNMIDWIIDSHIGWSLSLDTREQVVNIEDSSFILYAHNILEIVSIWGVELSADDYTIFGMNIILKKWFNWVNKVVYISWYDIIPNEIITAWKLILKGVMSMQEFWNVKSIRELNYSITFGDNLMSNDVISILNKYKIYYVGC